MANENETVAELHEWAHRESNRLYSYNYNRAPEMQEWWEDADIDDFADRALAAHKREIAAKDAEIKQLRIKLSRVMDVTGDCRKCQEEGDESCPWYGEPDGCNNREACAKFFDGKLVDPIKVKDAEIASLRALINELTKALEQRIDCSNGCDNCTMPTCTNQNNRRLIAKAREVSNG